MYIAFKINKRPVHDDREFHVEMELRPVLGVLISL